MSDSITNTEFNEASSRAQRLTSTGGLCLLSPLLVRAYRYRGLRPLVRFLLDRLEGGAMHSQTLRLILRKYFGVDAGLYSYGHCLKPGELPSGTIVGRYCSFASGIRVFRRNHPKARLSTHPFFYDHNVGIFLRDKIEQSADNPLTIGHDVWIATGAVILPNCRNIGTGAVVGACAVVTKDVPPFGIVVGNPAKLIGYRFDPALQAAILQSAWWEKSIGELGSSLEVFSHSLTPEILAKMKSNTPR